LAAIDNRSRPRIRVSLPVPPVIGPTVVPVKLRRRSFQQRLRDQADCPALSLRSYRLRDRSRPLDL
jgi:hypothetical protein